MFALNKYLLNKLFLEIGFLVAVTAPQAISLLMPQWPQACLHLPEFPVIGKSFLSPKNPIKLVYYILLIRFKVALQAKENWISRIRKTLTIPSDITCVFNNQRQHTFPELFPGNFSRIILQNSSSLIKLKCEIQTCC